ncbi:hypothetical protein H1D32_08930 [Anaerobacillus sp. CMMVII]|uniref:hypothetical protein n=1 Tax=Anaerobacillus sp. CMMVII TaxID=2755588 RepID=UPI0021B7E84D|nr:hypothetical protein [Anaerobacillus sp. CMMVII]MCT8137865.1 hypothetical protein [Anaerobacillus sp. CMMVII]
MKICAKHLVAVLLELKKSLEDTPSLSLEIAAEYPYNEPAIVMEYLRNDLDPYVKVIYQLLSKSGHFSNDHSSLVVQRFHEDLTLLEVSETNQLQIMAMTVVMDELYKKSNRI